MSPTDAWAVGIGNVILHWNGKAWRTSPNPVQPSSPELNGIAAFGPNDIWTVGSNDTSEHWNGTSWSFVPTPATVSALAAGGGGQPLWGVGSQTTVGQHSAQTNTVILEATA